MAVSWRLVSTRASVSQNHHQHGSDSHARQQSAPRDRDWLHM